MSGIGLIAAIGIPLLLFLLGGAATGISALVKFTVYMTKSREAQESTAKSNLQIVESVKQLSSDVNQRFGRIEDTQRDHGERISVLEDRTGVLRHD